MSTLFSPTLKALAGLALVGLCLGGQAHAESDAAAPEAQPATDGLRVSIDPLTRRIRPLTPSETDKLNAARAARPPAAESQPQGIVSRATGARGIVMGPEHLSYARAAMGANGKLTTDCVDGDEAAELHDHPVARQAQAAEATK